MKKIERAPVCSLLIYETRIQFRLPSYGCTIAFLFTIHHNKTSYLLLLLLYNIVIEKIASRQRWNITQCHILNQLNCLVPPSMYRYYKHKLYYFQSSFIGNGPHITQNQDNTHIGLLSPNDYWTFPINFLFVRQFWTPTIICFL